MVSHMVNIRWWPPCRTSTITVCQRLRIDINIVLDDDDDDVIVLPTEEPTVTEIQDEDAVAHTAPTTPPPSSSDDAKLLGDAAASSTPAVGKLPVQIMNYEPVGNESDLQILVPQISVLDLDEFEERSVEERAAAAEVAAQQLQVKIKEEPRNQGYRDELEAEEEDDGFEEVGTIESAAIDDDSGECCQCLFSCVCMKYLWHRLDTQLCVQVQYAQFIDRFLSIKHVS